MRRSFLWSLLLIPLLISCSPSPRAEVSRGCVDAQAACLQGKAIVQMSTSRGDLTIEVDGDAAPLTAGNFVDLVNRGVYDGTMFHRVVPKFIIQGGNSDSSKSMKKRREIGRYLLPPDTKNGNSHHRGVISMPSSEIDNPHKLASPYEFFIVQQSPGAYHLDGNYTAFGKVIKGMDVVDQINQEKVDKREMPIDNIYIKIRIIN